MALKTINESPKITDTIRFEIETPNASGCFVADPYKVDSLVIYFVERDYQKLNYGSYDKTTYDDELLASSIAADALVCQSPTDENILNATRLREQLESSKKTNTFYFKDRYPQKVIGTELFPAWLSTDTENALISKAEDEDGNEMTGVFNYDWTPDGDAKEGDYFLCWTWTPNIAGGTLSSHISFSVGTDPKSVSTLPKHQTVDDKYTTLLERYLPEMYKQILCDGDLTPDTLEKFNASVAEGFTLIEDLANQIIDLYDANVLHQSLLVYLSNLFALKLKSTDSTLWRRQIKRAVPVFKRKGTITGLREAFSQAGMTLDKLTQYWQVVSQYTWEESFEVTDSVVFELEKDVITPIDEENFSLYIRYDGTDEYVEFSKDYVSFSEDDCTWFMTWIGEDLSANPVALAVGDIVRVRYKYKEVPSSLEQNIEDYILTLPLADQRDEADQTYPPKNWNVRLIEEDDVMFDVVIPVRHPFQEPLIFGQIRTEFPYSENIYNMEEYNGSTRDSTDPCYIDKSFRDPCGSCISSKITVDVSVKELSNERMVETQEILDEYTPFHSVVHSINFSGEVSEYIQPPVETIETLVLISMTEKVLSGNFNPIFHRVIPDGLLDAFKVARDDLAEQTTVLSGLSGTGYNQHISVVAPDVNFDNLGIIPSYHIFEVLSPHVHAGTYLIDLFDKNTARIISAISEPINQSQFTFHLSNVTYTSTSSTITQSNLFQLTDANVDFAGLNAKSIWDVDNTPDYTGSAWTVNIPAYGSTYDIESIDPNGIVFLVDDGTLPSSDASGITYTLLNDDAETVATSTTGELDVTDRALINLNDAFLLDIAEVANIGDYIEYDDEEYEISEFDGNNIYIIGYSDGDAAGADISIRKRLVRNKVGYFGYRGLTLTTAADHESGLGILNGNNAPSDEDLITDDSNFYQNYLFKIDDDYYKIAFISGDEVILEGQHQDWTTTDNGGTAVTYDVLHFEKNSYEIKFDAFDQIDRDGHDIVERQILDSAAGTVAINILQSGGSGSQVLEHVTQEENISYSVEWSNGETEEGDL